MLFPEEREKRIENIKERLLKEVCTTGDKDCFTLERKEKLRKLTTEEGAGGFLYRMEFNVFAGHDL